MTEKVLNFRDIEQKSQECIELNPIVLFLTIL